VLQNVSACHSMDSMGALSYILYNCMPGELMLSTVMVVEAFGNLGRGVS